MAIDQDARETVAGTGPQTPAARRRRARDPEAIERLRAESRARRHQTLTGDETDVVDQPAPEITIRRVAPEAPAVEPPAPAPPAAPRRQSPEWRLPALRLPGPARERATALIALASAVGVVLSLATTIGSGHLPGLGSSDMEARASTSAVAPGGWIELTGSNAPRNTQLTLESRSRDGHWRAAGEGPSDGDGDFRIRARLLERPGPVTVRARAGSVAADPVPISVRPLRLASVGDINLGDAPGEAIAAHGPRYPWLGTGRALRSADLAFGNLECAISSRGEPVAKEYNFRGTPAALAGLRRSSGIDVLNLANNHVGDYGPTATVDTVRGVERLGMKAVGAGAGLRRALAPQVVERLGLRVAFVGFSEIAPMEFAAGPGRPGTAWANPESIADAVRAARRKADVVVATFHWGIERQTLETARQRELADVAIGAGAQVVIGAHPHTLQPVRREGGAIVAYSLGNFVFGAHSPETSTTGILELDLTAEGVTGATWRRARIAGGRPLLQRGPGRRLPLRDAVTMEAGVNL